MGENLHRRHLTVGQKAALACDIEKLYAVEAKQKQIEAGRFEGKNPDGTPKLKLQVKSESSEAEILEAENPATIEPAQDKPWERQAANQAAKMVGVGSTSVKQAKFLEQNAPELFDEVKQGKVAVDRAYNATKARMAKLPKPEAADGEGLSQAWKCDISMFDLRYSDYRVWFKPSGSGNQRHTQQHS